MGSYLDAYAAAGAQSERRGKLLKRIVVSVLVAAVCCHRATTRSAPIARSRW